MIKPVSLNLNSKNYIKLKNKPVFTGESKNTQVSSDAIKVLSAAGLLSLAVVLGGQFAPVKEQKTDTFESSYVGENSPSGFSIEGFAHKQNRKISGQWLDIPFSTEIVSITSFDRGLSYATKDINIAFDSNPINWEVNSGIAKFDRVIEDKSGDTYIEIKGLVAKHDRVVKGKINQKKVDFSIKHIFDDYDRKIKGVFAGKSFNFHVDGNLNRYDRKISGDFNGKAVEIKIKGNANAYNREVEVSFESEEKQDKKDLFLLYTVLRESTDLGEIAYYNP